MLNSFMTFKRGIEFALKKKSIRLSFIYTIVVIVSATALLTINRTGATYNYEAGDIAREDIRAPMNIEYPVALETEIEKNRIAESMPAVFDLNESIVEDKLKICNILCEAVIKVKQQMPDTNPFEQVLLLRTMLPDYLQYSDKVLIGLLQYDEQLLHRDVNKVILQVYNNGILEKQYTNPLKLKSNFIVIRVIGNTSELKEKQVSIDALYDINKIKTLVPVICKEVCNQPSNEVVYAISSVVMSLLQPNLFYNEEETKKRITDAIQSVKPVMRVIKKGQSIAREGDTITEDVLKKIDIINKNSRFSGFSFVLGLLLTQLGFLIIFGYFLITYYTNLVVDNKMPLIVFTLVMAFIIITFFMARWQGRMFEGLFFPLLLPIPLITMILAIMYNIHIAMLIGMYIVFFVAIITKGDFTSLLLAFSSALSGVFVVGDVERRSDFLRGGFTLGLINSVIVVSVGLMNELSFAMILNNIGLAFVSGIINAIVVFGVFPIYENLFGLTTKFKLLELSDLNAPIFREMLIKAPGTYNHSIMVATLAESACKEIGANALLARVGGYYHDIGKIQDANFYIENKVTDPRAKKLSALEYCKLIISHVEKGVELARKNNLPEMVIDFIREHHGQTVMTYFYHQALEESGASGDIIQKSDFQYPGPKPHTRETAVVMLADAIEAAARSIQEPTIEKLESLIKRIINNRLNEGDLDHADITMNELNKIQHSILRVLQGIFHSRIEYPTDDEINRLEQRSEHGH
ncbi:MAG TPA: HDIG domain-containing protein [Spirochaetota bacterium]|nr:HDIG domain-containing protein [Spirochaetota bacterium]HRV15530.1 HDIG domain-containing protein [Spirochaetota bacterium]